MNTRPTSNTPPISSDTMRDETIAYLDRRIHLLTRELEQTRRYTQESGDIEAAERSRVLRVKIERAVERLRRLLG